MTATATPRSAWLITPGASGHTACIRLGELEDIEYGPTVTRIRAGGGAPIEVPASDPPMVVRSAEPPHFTRPDSVRSFVAFVAHWRALRRGMVSRTEVVADTVEVALRRLELARIARWGRA